MRLKVEVNGLLKELEEEKSEETKQETSPVYVKEDFESMYLMFLSS